MSLIFRPQQIVLLLILCLQISLLTGQELPVEQIKKQIEAYKDDPRVLMTVLDGFVKMEH